MSGSEQGLEVTWCFHSYFVISYEGVSLAIDPHDGGSLNLPECRVEATYVLVTHDHYDHNAVEMASGRGTAKVIRWSRGSWVLGPFKVRGLRLSHGNGYGITNAYVVEAAGLRVAHLGDVGEPLTEDHVKTIGRADVVMVPAGNVTTVSQRDAVTWALGLGAKIVIPMHFWVPGSTAPLDPIDSMLAEWRGHAIIRSQTFSLRLNHDSLPAEPTLVLFPY